MKRNHVLILIASAVVISGIVAAWQTGSAYFWARAQAQNNMTSTNRPTDSDKSTNNRSSSAGTKATTSEIQRSEAMLRAKQYLSDDSEKIREGFYGERFQAAQQQFLSQPRDEDLALKIETQIREYVESIKYDHGDGLDLVNIECRSSMCELRVISTQVHTLEAMQNGTLNLNLDWENVFFNQIVKKTDWQFTIELYGALSGVTPDGRQTYLTFAKVGARE